MRAAPHLAGGLATGDAAIRRAIALQNTPTEAALEHIEIDEAFEILIEDAINDADRQLAARELGTNDVWLVEARAFDIVAERLSAKKHEGVSA